MLYIRTWEHKELGKMYKVLKDMPHYERVSAGDVVISCIAEEDRRFPSSDEEREWFFEFTKDSLGDRFDEWLEEIDEAYYYNSKTKQVESIDIEEAYSMNWEEEHKYCFADEDKALELLEEDKNKNLPKDDHTSETDLDSIPDSEFNYVIENEGTISDLEKKVLDLFKENMNEE